MSRRFLKMAGILGMAAALAAGGVFAGSAMADAYDLQYGEAADIARASQWALDPEYEEGGWAGANYYDNEEDQEDQGGWAGANYYENEAEYSSSRRSSRNDDVYYVYVDNSYTPDDYTGDCWWSGRTAHWDGQRESGEKYEIQLRRDGSEVTTVKTTGTSYDFGSNTRRDGYYKFRVRIVKGSRHGDWGDYSEERYFSGSGSSSSSSSSSGGPGSNIVTGWNRDNRGWWYLNPNGTYLANCWQLINGKWYCFGPDGYMRTGWINWNGVYYFCGPNGDMYTNCYTPDGYYVDANGVWVH